MPAQPAQPAKSDEHARKPPAQETPGDVVTTTITTPDGIEVSAKTIATDGQHGNKHHPRRHRTKQQDEEAVQIFFFLVFFMLGAQLLLFWWKKKHLKSYSVVTLMGLWLFPIIVSINMWFIKMIVAWSIFSCGTIYVGVVQANRAQLDRNTPRLVYRWFLLVYRICYSCAVSGYAAIMLDFFGFSDIFMDRHHNISQLGTYLLFYGLYFGVMGRDFAEVCAERLANKMGYSNSNDKFATRALPPNTCAICGK
jgi:RING finger protein 121